MPTPFHHRCSRGDVAAPQNQEPMARPSQAYTSVVVSALPASEDGDSELADWRDPWLQLCVARCGARARA